MGRGYLCCHVYLAADYLILFRHYSLVIGIGDFMADKNIKAVFNDVCKDLKIDIALSKRIEHYRIQFITKNIDHSAFFGGNLTGVYPIRFQDRDNDRWFEEILKVDESLLTDRCHAIIDPDFYKTASNVMNLSIVWLAHRFYNEKNLSEKVKQDTMVSLFQILQYPVMTSRIMRHWKYPADKGIAEATLAAMSNKYAIKRKGSWNAVLLERAQEIANMKTSIHRRTIMNMEVDLAETGQTTAYLINDTRNRLRSMIKNIYDLYLQQLAKGNKIIGQDSHVTLEGEEHLRDISKANEKYRRYLFDIIPERNAFIKEQLVAIIERSVNNLSPRVFESTLEWMSTQYNQRDVKIEIDSVCELIMTHVLSYLGVNKQLFKQSSDLPTFLTHMKGIYTSSRTKEPAILEIRDKLENIVYQATRVKTPNVVTAARTGIWLYIILRVFTMSYYLNQ